MDSPSSQDSLDSVSRPNWGYSVCDNAGGIRPIEEPATSPRPKWPFQSDFPRGTLCKPQNQRKIGWAMERKTAVSILGCPSRWLQEQDTCSVTVVHQRMSRLQKSFVRVYSNPDFEGMPGSKPQQSEKRLWRMTVPFMHLESKEKM